MTTPRDLILAAYATSIKNQPNKLATIETELLRVANDSIKACAAIAARVNPVYPFGTTADVVFASGGWAMPADADSVFLIKNADGEEVVEVALDQPRSALGDPAVYLLGRKFYPAGNALDPTSGTLTFWYAKRPAAVGIDTAIDASWLTDFNSLPIYDIGTYLAIKDGRNDELPGLKTQLMSWLAAYVAHLEHATVGTVSRFGVVRYSNPGSLVSLAALLVSGSSGPGSASGAT